MKQSKHALFGAAFAALAFLFVMMSGASAQDITHPSTTKDTGPATHAIHKTHVENAEVIHISGHEIVVKLQNGKLELLNLPKGFLFDVNGKQLTVHELTPGTKLTQEIHTVSTPQEVTTIRTVNGTVWHRNGRHVILSFPDGKHKQYTAREGTVFNIDGEEKTVYDLRNGMEISATVVTVEPQQFITTHTVVSGQAPPAPTVPFEGPLLIEPAPQESAPAVTAQVEAPVRELPNTGSLVPLTGLLGLLLLAAYAGLKIVRKNTA